MNHKITVEVDENGIPLKYCPGVSYPLHRFSYDCQLSIIAQYIPLGVDINCRDKQGRTPLHEACCISHNTLTTFQDELLIVKFLVENGADVMAIDHLGETPLHCVARHRICRSVASYLVIEVSFTYFDINHLMQLYILLVHILIIIQIHKGVSLACAARLTDTKCPQSASFGRLGSQ